MKKILSIFIVLTMLISTVSVFAETEEVEGLQEQLDH